MKNALCYGGALLILSLGLVILGFWTPARWKADPCNGQCARDESCRDLCRNRNYCPALE